EANNELQNLRGKEEREVARILFELTENLREQLPAVEAAVEAVTEIDAIKAKGEFVRKFCAIVPEISEDGALELVDARHPPLEENLRTAETPRRRDDEAETRSVGSVPSSDGIVPSSFALTKEKSVMIISGANAGGKTVVLKTAGLLSLMGISGLPVSAMAAK